MDSSRLLELRLLGCVELRRDTGHLVLPQHPRVKWILAALGLSFPNERSRDALADMLYPERPLCQARSNLRTLLSRLRAELARALINPDTVLNISRSAVGLNPNSVKVDWAEFRAAAHSDDFVQWERAVNLYRGDLAPTVIANWAQAERERGRALLSNLLERLICRYINEDQTDLALRYIERATELLPDQSQWYEYGIRIGLQRHLPEVARYWIQRARNALRQGILIGTPHLQDALCQAEQVIQSTLRQEKPVPMFVPRAVDRFWGRTRELEAIHTLIAAAFTRQESRIITLTGLPGVGKTRLAMELAHQFCTRTGFSTFFVPMLGIQSGQSILEHIFHFLRALRLPNLVLYPTLDETLWHCQPALLVLDGFENVHPESVSEVLNLSQRLPSLVCLVTSRRRLNFRGEVVYRVRPLPQPSHYDLSEPALCLLLDRCGIRPMTRLSESERNAAVAICQLMDGNPLGLEIVARWFAIFSFSQIADMLRDGELLNGESCSLYTAIRHTINTLESAERELLLQLSMFEGRFSIAAVRAIAQVTSPHLLLRALHDASLIEEERIERTASGQTIVYYHVYDSVRSVCTRYLSDTQKSQFIDRHALHYTQLAEKIDQSLYLGDAPALLHQLDLEMGNLSRALRHLWETGQHTWGQRLTLGLRHYWYLRALYREGEEWLGRYLTAAALTPDVQARLLAWQGLMRAHQYGMEAGRVLFQQAIQNALASDEPTISREAVACFALSALYNGDRDALRMCCNLGNTILSRTNDPIQSVLLQIMQAWLAAENCDYTSSQKLCQQARISAQERRFHFLECIDLIAHALYCLPPDTPKDTRHSLLQDALQIAKTHGYLPLELLINKEIHRLFTGANSAQGDG